MTKEEYNDRIDLLDDEISDNESEIEMMELEIRILERERDEKYPDNPN